MRKVFKKGKKFIACLIMAMALVVGGTAAASMQAMAAETDVVEVLKAEKIVNQEIGLQKNARTMMTQCIISVNCSAAGMHIDITTGTVGTASVLGVKDIVIKKKVWYGWKTVATSTGAEDYNCNIMGVSLDYVNAEYDETYCITCVHYANVDGYIEGENDTGSIVFTY